MSNNPLFLFDISKRKVINDLPRSAIKMLPIGLQSKINFALEEEELEFEEWIALSYHEQEMLENYDASELIEIGFYKKFNEIMSELKKSNYAKYCRFQSYFCLHVQ